jgi:hypothetical protein
LLTKGLANVEAVSITLGVVEQAPTQAEEAL